MNEISKRGNSSLGNHCTDFTNFERTAEPYVFASPSKFVKNSTSATANTRIVDSTSLKSQVDSAPCHFERSEKI